MKKKQKSINYIKLTKPKLIEIIQKQNTKLAEQHEELVQLRKIQKKTEPLKEEIAKLKKKENKFKKLFIGLSEYIQKHSILLSIKIKK
jgi:hypothetical protein